MLRSGVSLTTQCFVFTPASFFTVRNEFYDDKVGSRTSSRTKYSEHSVGLTSGPINL